MKTKSLFTISAVAVMMLLLAGCGTRKSQAYYDQKSKVIGTELDGSYTIRAWGRARNAADAYVQAQKQAVYDVIFSEIQFVSGQAPSSTGTLRPLIFEVNARQKYEDYFNAFFADGGEYKDFSSMKEKRQLSTNYAKTDAQTVAQVTVCVWRARLREKLIADGIIK
ncbi:MAG: hypothetical protein IJ776_07815 [Paludibacteraceae bacterium]|nr:hypothetical protein [Paludibacteraceae bacterium]